MGRVHPRFTIHALATAISVAGSACGGSGTSERLTDQVGLIPVDQRPRYESHLAWLYDETGIDCRFLFVPDVGTQTLEQFAVRKARELRVGRKSDRRGVLFAYDLRDKRLRIEVGPQLEGVLTDAFVGYLMHDHARYFFESGDPNLGRRLTLFILEARIREAALGQDYDPKPVKSSRTPEDSPTEPEPRGGWSAETAPGASSARPPTLRPAPTTRHRRPSRRRTNGTSSGWRVRPIRPTSSCSLWRPSATSPGCR